MFCSWLFNSEGGPTKSWSCRQPKYLQILEMNRRVRRAESRVCVVARLWLRYIMKEYEFHPFANAFPMMNDRELEELAADIKTHGQREPITLYQDQILDGRNRYNACGRAALRPIKPTFVDFTGTDQEALAFVVSRNLRRRQLTTSQRAFAAAKIAELKRGQRKSDTSIDVSQAEAAKLMNVSLPSTQRARKVIDKGSPELLAAVERGEIAVSAAVAQIEAVPPIGTATTNGHAHSAIKPKTPKPGRFAVDKRGRLVSEEAINDLGDAIQTLMNVETIEAWLSAFPGHDLRRLGNHINTLIAKLDAR